MEKVLFVSLCWGTGYSCIFHQWNFDLQDVLRKGTRGWKKVVAAFGEEILRPNGEVDRPKLGQIVFSDPGKRQLLNRWNLIFTLYFEHAHFQNIVVYCHLVYVLYI